MNKKDILKTAGVVLGAIVAFNVITATGHIVIKKIKEHKNNKEQ